MKRLLFIFYLFFAMYARSMHLLGDAIINPLLGVARGSLQEQECIAQAIMHRTVPPQKSPSFDQFYTELRTYQSNYTDGPVWCAAQARLGDLLRATYKEKAKAAYLAAFKHQRPYYTAKGWAGMQLGYICLYEKQYEKAVEYFLASYHIVDSYYRPHAFNGLGVAYFGSRQINNALLAWDYVVRWVEARKKEFDQIPPNECPQDKLRIFAELDRFKARALFNSAEAYEQCGEFDRAERSLTESHRLRPTLSESDFIDRVNRLQWRSALKSQGVSQ